ncbi:beta-ketoacyl-[acyl-carrier-protein] synthase family protein [Bacillus paralicheniformis]|nr:beta-ketoacyl-[acyl-carrier-protein] synthase family protein [Bacillus paralicheniformis]MSO02954.1 beta-ketoacyl-[acyl-carrier-protein] synthase family protein [Bacillus paralicheniformis]MSO06947.1 beta-ketoacyl-[acyl-carrier-protein] synthase family protein [Bacillus paralicheniformis]MSO10941.1 beta-ketoacyl-[acyl-carrier-protein] synthase family protein [Bacillus paralicheniformis]NJE35973.1 beta-ketoacyl-[acyl-carrier-protein] synthase family protein [Bacillus paralicheniformis]
MELKKRVVVTGIGIISSIGIEKNQFWKNCKNGVSGISKIDKSNLNLLDTLYGGQVKDFKASDYNIPKQLIKQCGRASQFLIASMDQAIKDSRIDNKMIEQSSLYVGSTMAEIEIENTRKLECVSNNDKKINDPSSIIKNASKHFGIRGYSTLITNACSAGNYALIEGYESIKRGESKTSFVGGTDPFSTVAYYGFNSLNAVAPEKCSPFDKNRKGMLVAEGAGVLLLEDLQSAINRKAPIYCEIAGYGVSNDAYHITSPHPQSRGIIECVQNALDNAKITSNDIDYICAHGTGTKANDKVESFAIKSLFDATKVCVSSIKSMLGHSMGAASVIESIVCCLAIKDSIVPPTINFRNKDDECNINCIPNKLIKKNINYALNNSYAFGGANASVILKKYKKGDI